MENSKIEWTDHTFNPWSGCIKVSPGCVNCYAETLSNRWGKDVWGPGPKRQRTSAANWKKPLQWNKQAIKEGRRFKVFCASMADVFEDNPQIEPWRVDLLELIQETPRLDWLLLTKRPENVNWMIEQATGFSEAETWFHSNPNVWIGTSVENQEYAEERIPELLKIPARIRFLSMEPLLGPVDLEDLAYEAAGPKWAGFNALVDWVIVGGESGHHARPMHPAWVRLIKEQCQKAGVAFFFKQWGEWTNSNAADVPYPWQVPNIKQYQFEDGHWVWKYGKHAAGRLLDGVEYSQFPGAVLRQAEEGA